MSTASFHIERLLEPLVDCLTTDVAKKVCAMKADNAMQDRIDYLADRSNEGLLTAEEREEYQGYLHVINVIAILQAKARSLLREQS